jgi:hypothetical protein
MATYTPERWHIHNELDNFGLLLDLPRIAGERNAAYKQRLMDVFVHRAGSDRLGLIYGITRELGLDLYHAMTITPVLDADGNTVGDNPAIIFEDTKCYVYSDYTLGTSGLEVTIDRYEYDGGAYNYTELLTQIQATGFFAVAIRSGVSSNTRSMTIFNQSSVELIVSESISTSGAIVNLEHANLFSDSVSITSSNLRERVSAQRDLARAGQYFIDYDKGIIYTTESPAGGSLIRYRYRNNNFKVWASPVIIHDLQSNDFETKMFEQITDGDGNTVNGAATELGADCINELLSIYGVSIGE